MKTHSGKSETTKPKASRFAAQLLSQGRTAVTTDEAAKMLGIPKDHVRQRFEAPRKRGEIVSPARGLWVPVPPERLSWGAPEPDAYLDAMMSHIGTSYYVGWLTAASLHGASHQAPQVYQVATAKTVADRMVGRTRLRFVRRAHVKAVPCVRVSGAVGMVTASSVAATMLDLMEDLELSAGIDIAATAVIELAEIHRTSFEGDLIEAAKLHTVACVRRLGWVLEELAGVSLSSEFRLLAHDMSSHTSLLLPELDRAGHVSRTWRLDINTVLEPEA